MICRLIGHSWIWVDRTLWRCRRCGGRIHGMGYWDGAECYPQPRRFSDTENSE